MESSTVKEPGQKVSTDRLFHERWTQGTKRTIRVLRKNSVTQDEGCAQRRVARAEAAFTQRVSQEE